MLTATQQDYLETVLRIEHQKGKGQVRVSDIAEILGTRLPTVTRSVQKLTDLGYIMHSSRGKVELSVRGRQLAGQMVHIHEDLVTFFTEILGLNHAQAEADACRLEHGFSPTAAQRLHEFLEHFAMLKNQGDETAYAFLANFSQGKKDFTRLPDAKVEGWRA